MTANVKTLVKKSQWAIEARSDERRRLTGREGLPYGLIPTSVRASSVAPFE